MHGRHVDPEGPATEVMEPVRLDDTGQLPAVAPPVLDVGHWEITPEPGDVVIARGPVRRRRGDESGDSARAWVLLFALLAIAGIAFVAGQVTARTGAVPPPPVPQAAAEVVTAAQMARLWPLVEPDARDTFCGPWARDASWRQAAVDHWAQHLASPRGGQIDVDRSTVGEFLDTACARWEGG